MKSLKSTSTIFLFFFLTSNCFAQSFITTWKTDNQGVSNNSSITIPTHPNETYNYDVDWDNDGVFDEFGITGDVTHDFGITGTYTIAIQGDFPRIYFNDSLDKEKIIAINQWGNNVWTSMEKAFYGCNNLNGQTVDAPNLSMVTNMSYMFAVTDSFNQNISNWDVSNVTDMNGMFYHAESFNQNIDTWNVNNVTNMSYMFAFAKAFNQDISSWNISNVTNISDMFRGAIIFNQPIGQWNVSNVIDMSYIFNAADSFNQDISSWDVSNVINMSGLFKHADSFNQDISSWNVSNVEYMSAMFHAAPLFNQNLNSWDVGNVKYMTDMFLRATIFNQNLGDWNIVKVRRMNDIFSNSGLSVENYDSTLIGWEKRGTSAVSLGAYGLKYCLSDSVRNVLIFNRGWTITGDTYDCSGVNIKFLTMFQIFEIHPNPTNGLFFINAEFEKPINNIQIEIINTNGQIIQKVILGNNINAIQETINLSSIPKGSYYILIRSEIEQIGKMIIVN